MTMFIHFFCLCPLSLTIKLSFSLSKVYLFIYLFIYLFHLVAYCEVL